MKVVFVFALCLFFFGTVKAASDVIVLNEENWDDQIFARGTKDWLVEFYAPWCGHCRKLEPTWEALATQTKGRLNVGKVDATKNEELAALYDISGYPTIIYIRQGKMTQYAGPREKDHFISFALLNGHEGSVFKTAPRTLEEIPTPPTPKTSDVVVLTGANFSNSISSGKWLVEFYAPWCGHCKNLAPEWESLATDAKSVGLRVAKVDATQEPFLATLYEIKGYPTIKFFSGGKYYDYSGPRKRNDFIQFTRTGFQLAANHDVPSETIAILYKKFFEIWAHAEPYAKLATQDYLGVSFLVLTSLGLLVGFLLGRVTANPTRVYVLSQEQYEKYKKLREEEGAKKNASGGQAEKQGEKKSASTKKGGKEGGNDSKQKGGKEGDNASNNNQQKKGGKEGGNQGGKNNGNNNNNNNNQQKKNAEQLKSPAKDKKKNK